METMRRVVMVACAALLFLPVYMKSRTSQDVPVRTAFQAFTSSRISVKVSGDVVHPGIYEVPANALAVTVINMAVPLHQLKQPLLGPLAHPLTNGAAVKLAFQSDGSYLLMSDQITVPERMVLGLPLDITSMREADFERLPGIGPALAKRIVEYRQNNGGVLGVDDLTSIVGIGEKKSKMIRAYLQHP